MQWAAAVFPSCCLIHIHIRFLCHSKGSESRQQHRRGLGMGLRWSRGWSWSWSSLLHFFFLCCVWFNARLFRQLPVGSSSSSICISHAPSSSEEQIKIYAIKQIRRWRWRRRSDNVLRSWQEKCTYSARELIAGKDLQRRSKRREGRAAACLVGAVYHTCAWTFCGALRGYISIVIVIVAAAPAAPS